MRDLGTLAAHVEQDTMTLAVCWRMVTTAGIEYGFTACSRDLVIDGLTYKANTGLDPTAVEIVAGLQVDNSEVIGFLKDGVIEADQVAAGIFDGATVYKFLVDYTDPDSGSSVKLIWGVLGEVQVVGATHYQAELRGGSQWLAANITPLTQATCRAKFADPVQCKATMHTNNGAVTSVTSLKLFADSALIGVRPDGYFDYGYLLWTGGSNTGLKMDVRHFNQATGGITLMAAAIIAIEVGDTFTVYEGCAKTRAACIAKGNIINMDAEPDVPGNDILLKIQRAS